MNDAGILAGFLSVGLLIIINIILAAYSYGKLRQSVNDLCRRVDSLEKKVYK